MEIKRFADHFIVDINSKTFNVYWKRELDFGANLIRRFFERHTDAEIDVLYQAIQDMNQSISTRNPMDEKQLKNLEAAISRGYLVIANQMYAWIGTVDTEFLKTFIDNTYPAYYRFWIHNSKLLYTRRFEGCETEVDRKYNECSCMEDWNVFRESIVKQMQTDIGNFRFFLIANAKNIIAAAMNDISSEFRLFSFFSQVFMNAPAISDMNTRSYKGEAQERLRKIIHQNFVSRHTWSHAKIMEVDQTKAKTEYHVNRLSLRKVINSLRSIYPVRSLLHPGKFLTYTNEERRLAVLDFFRKMDQNLPDDIEFLKKHVERCEQARLEKAEKEKQNQEQLDKAFGKSEDQKDLHMTLTDEETGEVVSEIPIAKV